MLRILLGMLLGMGIQVQAEPGHSEHGDAFNEGPRRFAKLTEGTGNVDFPLTTKVPEAKKFFDQGIGQLHGFWYYEAERSFRQAAYLDPSCAMAYWGMAMANKNNEERAKGFIEKAMSLKDEASPMEQRFIELLNQFYHGGEEDERRRYAALGRGFEQIAKDFPEEIEPKAFYVIQLWHNRSKRVPLRDYESADRYLAQVLEKNPNHPCHHYRIHLWDNEDPERALQSALSAASAAPAIAHMWHMPNHIYSKLHRYQESVWHQEAAARVDHTYIKSAGILPDQIHNYAHNNEWFCRNLAKVGRISEAIQMARNLCEIPRHPKFNTPDKNESSSHEGRQRLRELLIEFEQWKELEAECLHGHLQKEEGTEEKARWQHSLGLAYANKGETKKINEIIQSLKGLLKDLEVEREKALAKAQAELAAKSYGETNIKKGPGGPPRRRVFSVVREQERVKRETNAAYTRKDSMVEGFIDELEVHELLLQGNKEEAVSKMEGQTSLSGTRAAKLWQRLGQLGKAIEEAQKAADRLTNEVAPLALLCSLQHQAGLKGEAKPTFEELRSLSSSIELNHEAFKSINSMASELGYEADWRTKNDLKLQQSYDIKSLGPMKWAPLEASPWELTSPDKKQVSLSDYENKPFIVIFYLGRGCAHCMEQLNAFKPRTKDFEDMGISLVGVSTDSVDGLRKTFGGTYIKNDFPFPLVSDKNLKTFKEYGCYDDFEGMPLHGTFLIDGKGKVRWQDISFEPFTDVEFLLNESHRLLSIQE